MPVTARDVMSKVATVTRVAARSPSGLWYDTSADSLPSPADRTSSLKFANVTVDLSGTIVP